MSGKVIEVAVHNNQQVKKGDLLFRLDPAPFELAVEQARLALAQAEQQNSRTAEQQNSRTVNWMPP